MYDLESEYCFKNSKEPEQLEISAHTVIWEQRIAQLSYVVSFGPLPFQVSIVIAVPATKRIVIDLKVTSRIVTAHELVASVPAVVAKVTHLKSNSTTC